MDVSNLTIVWHDNNEPVYSVHFQPNRDGNSSDRLVTGGGDNNVRIWKVTEDSEGKKAEYLSTLARHTQAVNVVRFDPKGEILATGGDDGTVLLWTLSESVVKEFGQEDDEDLKESWVLRHACRSSSSEIYDLAWSPDSKYIITGSTDNVSRIYDATTGQQVNQIAEHNHYVQGVAWDPMGKFVATQSADRSIHIYSLTTNKKDGIKESLGISPTVYFKISRTELPTRISITDQIDSSNTAPLTKENLPKSIELPSKTATSTTTSIKSPRSPSPLPAVRQQAPLNFGNLKSSMLYHTENLESFFRRLTFSPDGHFLFTPSGIFKNKTQSEDNKEDLTNTVYIYSRSGLNKPPIAHLPGFKKPALVVAFSPVFYELDKNVGDKSTFELPYKMIYAVATQDSVFIFDTQHENALGSVSSIHYRILTDLSWNADGDSLIVSSADGFCSIVSFKDGELGTKLNVDHRSLLPETESDSRSSMASPKVKKRPVNDMLDFISKKKKLDDVMLTPPKLPIAKPTVTKEKSVEIKEDAVILVDDAESGQVSSNQATVVQTPGVKKKKRVQPTLMKTNAPPQPKSE